MVGNEEYKPESYKPRTLHEGMRVFKDYHSDLEKTFEEKKNNKDKSKTNEFNKEIGEKLEKIVDLYCYMAQNFPDKNILLRPMKRELVNTVKKYDQRGAAGLDSKL